MPPLSTDSCCSWFRQHYYRWRLRKYSSTFPTKQQHIDTFLRKARMLFVVELSLVPHPVRETLILLLLLGNWRVVLAAPERMWWQAASRSRHGHCWQSTRTLPWTPEEKPLVCAWQIERHPEAWPSWCQSTLLREPLQKKQDCSMKLLIADLKQAQSRVDCTLHFWLHHSLFTAEKMNNSRRITQSMESTAWQGYFGNSFVLTEVH